jgi:hypothetical protein
VKRVACASFPGPGEMFSTRGRCPASHGSRAIQAVPSKAQVWQPRRRARPGEVVNQLRMSSRRTRGAGRLTSGSRGPSESSGRHFGRQIAVGGGLLPRIPDRLVGAHALERLPGARQSLACRARSIRSPRPENHPRYARSGLYAPASSPGECAFLMPEQPLSIKCRKDGGVEADQRPAARRWRRDPLATSSLPVPLSPVMAQSPQSAHLGDLRRGTGGWRRPSTADARVPRRGLLPAQGVADRLGHQPFD